MRAARTLCARRASACRNPTLGSLGEILGAFCSPQMWPVPWACCGARLGLFRGSTAKNTHFQKNDRFWFINNAPKINWRGLFECGPTAHTHGPLFQRKPHVKRHAGCLTALKSLKSPLADWAFLVRAGPRMPGHPPSAPKAAQKAPFHPQTKRGPKGGPWCAAERRANSVHGAHNVRTIWGLSSARAGVCLIEKPKNTGRSVPPKAPKGPW